MPYHIVRIGCQWRNLPKENQKWTAVDSNPIKSWTHKSSCRIQERQPHGQQNLSRPFGIYFSRHEKRTLKK